MSTIYYYEIGKGTEKHGHVSLGKHGVAVIEKKRLRNHDLRFGDPAAKP